MKSLQKILGAAGKIRNAFLIVGGLLMLLFGISKVPHFGNSAGDTHASTDMNIGGVAHAETGDSGGGGDSGGSGDSGGDSGGSGGGSSSGG